MHMLIGSRRRKNAGYVEQYVITTDTLEACRTMLSQMVALGKNPGMAQQAYNIVRIEPVEHVAL